MMHSSLNIAATVEDKQLGYGASKHWLGQIGLCKTMLKLTWSY